jgi:hypothetical protein
MPVTSFDAIPGAAFRRAFRERVPMEGAVPSEFHRLSHDARFP